MKILTGTQMKAFDQKAIGEYNIPSLVLMENAGRGIAEVMHDDIEDLEEAQILVISGKGNNGGDGLCAARYLINMGVVVDICVVGVRKDLSDECALQVEILEKSGSEILFMEKERDLDELREAIAHADVILDALLGIGVKGEPRGLLKPVIEQINMSQALIVAADVPSGVDADTGHVTNGTAVLADLTITLEHLKLGLLLNPGSAYAGDVVSTPIGYPSALGDTSEYEALLLDEDFARITLPIRSPYSHKGTYGRLLLIAGSMGLSGAALMAGEAALRTGLGLLYMGFPQSLSQVIEASLWEAVKLPWAEEEGVLSTSALAQIKNAIDEYDIDAIAIGPGISRASSAQELVVKLLREIKIPVVIDADGIYALSNPDGLSALKSTETPVVLTPHPGEFAVLSGQSVDEIENDRVGVSMKFAKAHGVVLVLKGVPTVIATPDGAAYLNSSGNSGLATGGSGDVLTGIIGGLLAQGLNAQYAAAVGVYLHGLLADRLSEEIGERAMLPRDLLAIMPDVLKEFE